MDTIVSVQALRWQQQITEGSVDWTRFTDWLERAPKNRKAYEVVALLDDMLARHSQAALVDPAN